MMIGNIVRGIGSVLRHPRRILQQAFDSEDVMRNRVVRKYGMNRGLPTIDILDMLPDFQEIVAPYSFLEGTSLPIDIALLKALARRWEHCSYLEIGSWRGESVANVAEVAHKCVTISLSNDEMRMLGISDKFIETHGVFSRGCRNIERIEHNSHTLDYSALRGKFDLVFVDGDHSYQGVKQDTTNVFSLLRDESSVIVWHDYGLSPETVRWSVLAGILDGCDETVQKNLYHVSNTLCAIYIRGNFKTSFEQFPQYPNKSFSINISAQPLER